MKKAVTAAYQNGFVSASDFSATDQHFTGATTQEVYDVIKHCFQTSFHSDLKYSMLHMNNIPLVTGVNEI